jgi:CheY-like chemotaxis protein
MRKKIILLVDDDPVALKMITETFRNVFGNALQYERASTAEEAEETILELLTLRGQLPSMIVTDWMMPGKRGDQFLREVHENYPEIPLVLCSGLANDETVQHIQNQSALLCSLPKPWDGRAEIGKIFQVLTG